MKKIAVEVYRRAGEAVTIIIPENIGILELLGVMNRMLPELGLQQARIIVGDEKQPHAKDCKCEVCKYGA